MSLRIFIAVTIGLAATGCTTWLDDRKQTVTVQTFEATSPVAGVSCKLANNHGQWTVITPGEVEVITSAQDLVVTCTKPDSTVGVSNAVARPSPDGQVNLTAAIVVPAGLPSSADQLLRGTAQAYPANIQVVMNEQIIITNGD